MRTIIIVIAFITNGLASAGEHSLGAHEHGAITLGMAIENKTLDLDLDGPTESFMSFEYLPKTEKEKKVFLALKNKWEKNLFDLIRFDKKMNCKIVEATLNQVIDQKETVEAQKTIKDKFKKEAGVHSDIEAKAKIMCAENVHGNEVVILLKKAFKNIKKLSVDVIGAEAKSIVITKEIESIKI